MLIEVLSELIHNNFKTWKVKCFVLSLTRTILFFAKWKKSEMIMNQNN
jgi:hypothetical protein